MSQRIASHLALRHEVTLVGSRATSMGTLRARSAFVLSEEIQSIAEAL